IDFTGVNISFFRDFPRVSVALENFYVAGRNEFKDDTLISAKQIDAAVNFMSLVKGSNYKIYSVDIEEPRIHAIVRKDGKANWDISLPDTSATSVDTTASAPFQMNLEKYSIHNGYISYQDDAGNMSTEIINLNHEGSGDFTSDLFTLKTKTSADAVTFVYGGIPYLSRTKTVLDADFEVDNKASKYTFKTDKVSLNDLKLHTEGFFQMLNDSVYNMDIRFNAPSADFKKILSLVPMIYQKDFATVKTNGSAIISGFLRGEYSNTSMPAYSLNLDIKNGFFQYADLPLPVKNINLSLKIDNPDGVTDHTVISIPKGHIEMDNDPFDFHLDVKHPVSDMFIDAGATGKVDLSKITRLVKLENGTRLSGMLDADMAVRGSMSAMEKQDFNNFTTTGNIVLQKFYYASKDYPDGVKLDMLNASFNPKNITLSQLDGSYMKTNFNASGSIDNLPAYVLKNQPLKGYLKISADAMNLNSWMGTSTDTAAQAPSSPAADASPFLVPANLDFLVNASIGEVVYDKVQLKKLSGSMLVNDETVRMKDIHADALDGTMNINGSYSTKEDKKHPDISLNYDVQGLDVQKTFYAFNTIQKLMPVGKYIAGKLTSKLSVTGKLGADMMPDLSTLTGNGSLFLIEGFLQKFAPLDKLASTLNIQQLHNISLKEVKNYIEFSNGKVMIKPFNLNVVGIQMEIGGSHGFDQSLDYVINLKMPRSKLGEKGNQLVDELTAQVNSRGIAVKTSDVVNLKINMGGSILDPVIKTNLKEAASSMAADLKQQATEFAKAKIDTAKKIMKDTVTALKNQVVATAKEEFVKKLSGSKDSTASSSTINLEDLKKKAGGTSKEMMKSLFGKKKKEEK
ncbi:MAG: AsmA-like C-terminal region-containing protein, partial [Flavisolibacter sp.]